MHLTLPEVSKGQSLSCASDKLPTKTYNAACHLLNQLALRGPNRASIGPILLIRSLFVNALDDTVVQRYQF